MPTPSCPGMNGTVGVTGQSPFAAWMSVWHSPDASIRTTTWPGPGSGIGRSSMTSGWPKPGTTAARMGKAPSRLTRHRAGPPTMPPSAPRPVGMTVMARRDLGPDSHSPKGNFGPAEKAVRPSRTGAERADHATGSQAGLYSPCYSQNLNGGAVPVTGPDAQGAVYRGDPYLPVADRFRPGVLGDGLDQAFHVVIGGDDIQPDLLQQYHPGQASPGGELAELPAETTDFGHGQAVSPVVDQGADQLVELVGPDDGCDQFHSSSPPLQPARFTCCACGGTCGCRPCPPAARGR